MGRVVRVVMAITAILLMGSGFVSDVASRGIHRDRGIAQAAGTSSPRKVALIVGIDSYPNLPERKQLKGPVNDAFLLAQTFQLPKFGFRAGDIHLLVSPRSGSQLPKSSADVHILPGQVTKQAIIGAFRKYLVADAHPNDILVFSYAGHGALWYDPQEPARRARTLVPTDSRAGSGTDILTVELAGLVTEALARRPGNLTIILDSCYSGSRTRGIAAVRGIPADLRPTVQGRYREMFHSVRNVGTQPSVPADQSFFTSARQYTLLAAAREDQVAIEDSPSEGAPVHGVFTRFFTEALRGSTTTSQTTYREVMEKVAVHVFGETDGQQLPVLEGERDVALFGGQVKDQRPYLVVRRGPEPSASIQLAAGQAAGITPGSVFDIYPSDDFTFADPARKLGALQITRVMIGKSVARLVSGSAPEGAHAVERIHEQPKNALRVKLLAKNVSREIMNAFRKGLRTSPFPIVVSASTTYDIAIADDPDKPGYIRVELADGDPLGGSFSISDPQTPRMLSANVAKYARIREIAAIGNPESQLAFSATWTVRTYDQTPIESRNGYPVLRAVSETNGDEISFIVTNRSMKPESCPLYAAIVNIAVNGAIIVVPEHTDVGVVIEDKPWSNVRFRMVVPKEMRNFKRGQELYKVVVSTVPVNLRSLEQGGYLMRTRDTRGLPIGCSDDWAVKDFIFWVDRRS